MTTAPTMLAFAQEYLAFRRALGFTLQEQRAQVGIQLRAILQLREAEGDREEGLNLEDHPARGKIAHSGQAVKK